MVSSWHALIVFIFCLLLGAVLSSFVISLFIVADTKILYLLSAITTQVIMFIGAAILYFRIMSIRVLQFVSFKKLTQRSVTLAGVILLLAIGVVFVVEPLADLILTHFSDHPWVLYQLEMSDIQNAVIGSLRGYRILIAIFVFAILPAICEELVFRGILYRVMKDISKHKQWSMILSAIVFAVFHFQVLSVLPIFIVGYLLALLYEKTNNLLPSMLVHFAFNGLQIVLWQA